MRFKIEHSIRYGYTQPVYLEPFAVRLRPRSDVHQRLLNYSLEIDPAPAGRSEMNELDGNATTLLWFNGLNDHLDIRASSRVETYLENPFDYLISDAECREVPFAYPAGMKPMLAPYLRANGEIAESVRRLAEEVREESTSETISFLSGLCGTIHSRVRTVIRHKGEPMTPEASLALGEGACRDVAVLFMEACRSMGLAARFVSGYQESSPENPDVHLHAWAEVYIPGGGWRGYDPTSGLVVADRHVSVATGARSAQAAPTSGTFRGTGVQSELAFTLSILASENS